MMSFVEPCSGKRSCRNGVCHAGGKSCRVTGSYRVGHAHVNDVGSYTLLACCGLLLFTAIALLIMSTGWKRLLGLVPFDSTITGATVSSVYVLPSRNSDMLCAFCRNAS